MHIIHGSLEMFVIIVLQWKPYGYINALLLVLVTTGER